MMIKNSIGFKVTLAYLTGVIFSILLLVLIVIFLFFYAEDDIANLELSMIAKRHAESLRYDDSDTPIGFIDNDMYADWIYENLSQVISFRVLDERGEVILSSSITGYLWEESTIMRDSLPITLADTQNDDVFYSAIERIYKNNKEYIFQIAISRELYVFVNRCFAVPRVLAGIFIFSIILFFVFIICSGITLKWAMKPLRELSDNSMGISPTSIHERLRSDNVPVEVAPLVWSFNKVLDRVEHGFRSQQDFLARVAHELKTPLALIRAQIELERSSSIKAALLNDVEHMSRQVQQLIMLAEVSEIQNYNYQKLNAKELVSEVFYFLEPIAKSLGVNLSTVETSSLVINADKSACFILLKNLLENALQHSPSGTSIVVTLDKDFMRVRDFGSGISEENEKYIFNRFWRGEHRRDIGAGLGLSICKEIAQAHNFSIDFERENPGVSFLLRNVS